MWWSHGDWGWGGWLVMTLGMVGVWATSATPEEGTP